MISANNNISFPENKILYIIYFVVAGVAAAIVSSIKKIHFRTGFVNKLNTVLRSNSLYINGLRLKADVCISKLEAKAIDHRTEKLINHYNSLYWKLEKVEFFTNPDTKDLIESSIAELYSIEAITKNKIFENTVNSSSDKTLQDFASTLSLGSLTPKE